ITGINVECWSEVDGGVINDHGCDGWGNYYRWSGSGHGGHVSYRSGDWENCVYWCFKSIYPWIEIWVNGNGAWAQDQGGWDTRIRKPRRQDPRLRADRRGDRSDLQLGEVGLLTTVLERFRS